MTDSAIHPYYDVSVFYDQDADHYVASTVDGYEGTGEMPPDALRALATELEDDPTSLA